MANIYIFGDSIAYGAWDIEGGGWVSRLRKELDKATVEDFTKYSIVFNFGVPGFTSRDVLQVFESDIKFRFDPESDSIFIFAIGINDSALLPGLEKTEVPIEEFRENLKLLFHMCRKYSNNIVFIGLTPVIEEDIDWSDVVYKNELISEFNSVIKEMASENKLNFVNIFEEIIAKDYFELIMKDGDFVHPNSKGHEEIYKLVRQQLKQVLRL